MMRDEHKEALKSVLRETAGAFRSIALLQKTASEHRPKYVINLKNFSRLVKK